MVLRVYILAALSCASPSMATACDSVECSCAGIKCIRRGAWTVASSRSFEVCSLQGNGESKKVVARCEALRSSLLSTLGLDDCEWNPRCQIVLHPTKAQYLRSVGRGGEATLGSALIRPTHGRILIRRIDLRSDTPEFLATTLPHEMCHVLLADRFRDGGPPLWYDEGLALLADRRSKQQLHQRDLLVGIRSGEELFLRDVLTTVSYPAADRMGVFYGQCASLTRLLLSLGPPEQIHRFAKRSKEIGVNLALEECYSIAGVPELERKWRQTVSVSADRQLPSTLPVEAP